MAELKARITADASGFHAAIKSAKSAILSLSGAVASFMTAKKLFKFSEALIDEFSKIGKASREIGVSTEEFQLLEAVSAEAGIGVEKLKSAFLGLQNTIKKAVLEGKDVELFKLLGIELEELKKRTPFEQFSLLSSALRGVSDEFQKSALAQKLFGDGSRETVAVLEGFNQTLSIAKESALIIDDRHVKKAEEFKKTIEILGKTIQALVAESGFLDWLTDVTSEFGKMISEFRKLERHTLGRIFFNELARTFGMADLQFDRTLTYIPAPTKEIAEYKKKVEKEKQIREEQNKIAESAKYFKVESDIEKAEKLRRENAEKAVKALEYEIFLLRLIRDGKEKEAEIERELNSLRERGVEITDDVKKKVEEMVELKKKEKTDIYKQPITEISDQLRRIGGTIGSSNIQIALDKERNNLLRQIAENTKKELPVYL